MTNPTLWDDPPALSSPATLPEQFARRSECSVLGCQRSTVARGLCGGHYKRLQDGRPLDGPIVDIHRLSYELAHGSIDDALQIDHLCRTSLCVRPSHLELVTQDENNRRGLSPSALNSRKERCIRGHEFTEENTYVTASGARQCRGCKRERDRSYRARRAA